MYERNNLDLKRGSFRVRGDVLEVVPASQRTKELELIFGDEIESINEFDTLTGTVITSKNN